MLERRDFERALGGLDLGRGAGCSEGYRHWRMIAVDEDEGVGERLMTVSA